jgi:transposase
MPLYRVAPSFASLPASAQATAGVACRCCPGGVSRSTRGRVYPSDMSDAEWAVIEPRMPAPGWRLGRGGSPCTYCRRDIVNAIRYLTHNGCVWRAMPADLPHWRTVYHYVRTWQASGATRRMHDELREQVRVLAGRRPQPTAAIIDSQSVKAADTVGAGTRGFDSGKKINGRKRHIAVDVEGLLLAVVVTAANVGDRMGAKLLVIALLNSCTRLKLIWADSGYDGAPLAGWIASVAGITLQVIKRTELHVFRVVPRRWVVERSFGWLLRYRRLVRDYERRTEHHEAMVYWATVLFMTRRLAQRCTDPPVIQRWGQPRSAASEPDPAPV